MPPEGPGLAGESEDLCPGAQAKGSLCLGLSFGPMSSQVARGV